MTIDLGALRCRAAQPSDAAAVAALHADSWRRHYRGAYADSYLDGDVEADRRAVWTERLDVPAEGDRTIVAEDGGGGLVGFVHLVLDHDATWGSYVENLHVRAAHKRAGIGTRLMAEAGRRAAGRTPGGLYLWVLEQNSSGQAFYEAIGGRRADRAPVRPPGGDPARLNGRPAMLRYVWPDAALVGRLGWSSRPT